MRRFWIDMPEWENDLVSVTGDLFHHLHDVCRFTVGDHFELLTEGQAWFVEVVAETSRSVQVRRLEARPLPEPARPHIHLALSLPRFSKIDWIVEKSVELGVKAIHPFVSDFSFVRDPSKLPAAKMQRWEKLIRQAAQQSGRGDLMELAEVSTLDQLLKAVNQKPGALGLFPYEGDCPLSLKAHIRALSGKSFNEIWVFVGSEGGFSKPEVELFASHGMPAVSLGSQVLRVETACLALASILKYEFEALQSAKGAHGSV
jgi:16S rRNA (uracil1498-N3)-methyltransferase